MNTFYKVSYGCKDTDPLQAELNSLYEYQHDVNTKIMHRCRMNMFVTLVERLFADGTIRRFEKAIDIGCNSGIYSKIISEFGFHRVLGIDIVPEYVERARSNFASSVPGHVIEFSVQNAEAVDPSIGTFDFLLSTEVIEHTDHPDKAIEMLPGLLAPGGIAVISFPNAASAFLLTYWYHRLKGHALPRELLDHMSWPWFKARKAMQGTGLRILETSGANLLPGGFILRMLYHAPGFGTLNHFNAYLSRQWPLKFVSQHYYMVLRKD